MSNSKLTDTQLIVLSSAVQREDGMVVLPDHLRGGAAAKVVKPLLAQELLKEIRASADMPVWRRDDGEGSFALVITHAGRKAINADAEEDGLASTKKTVTGQPKNPSRSSDDATPRPGSKLDLVLKMLTRSGGATIDSIVTATGWLPHTTRAALTGLRKRGYRIEKERKGGKTTYRIIGIGKARVS